jgi:hypothetical protein
VNLRDEQEPERVRAGYVTANTFRTLGVQPVRGRDFTEADDVPGVERAVLMSHALWQRRYGGANDIVGRTIDVNGRARQVIGVMPPGIQLPLDYREEQPTEVWFPLQIDAAGRLLWGSRSNFIFGRLAHGVPAARLDEIAAEIGRDIEEAITAAENEPDPDPTTLLRHVYEEEAE